MYDEGKIWIAKSDKKLSLLPQLRRRIRPGMAGLPVLAFIIAAPAVRRLLQMHPLLQRTALTVITL